MFHSRDFEYRRYDTRVGDLTTPDLVLEGHDDTVTGLAMSPDNNRLLSNSMDSTLRIWNVRPYHHSQSSRYLPFDI